MATTVEAVAETLPKVLSSMYASGGFPKMPEKNDSDKYRFYHCLDVWIGMECKKIDSRHYIPIGNNTKIVGVSSYIPEVLDSLVLQFNIPFITKQK